MFTSLLVYWLPLTEIKRTDLCS